MPRKNTGMPVEAHPSPKVAENGERLLYVKPQSGLTKSLDDFETWFGDKYSLRKGEITRAFEAFLDAAPEWLAKGYCIETPFGSFAPKVRLKRQVTDSDDIYHDDIELEGVEFQPIKAFTKKLQFAIGSEGFRYVRKPQSSRLLNNMQHLEEALQKCIQEHGYATVASFSFHRLDKSCSPQAAQ